MRSIIVVASIVLFGGTGSPACAQSFEQLKKWCSGVGVSDEQTIQGCDAVIRSGKQSPEDQAKAFYLRGDTYSGMGQIDRAIQDFDQAIKLKPDYAVAFLNRSWAYDLKDQMDRAIDDMGKFIELQPADPDGYAIRGSKYVRIGQYDRALRDFDQAIKLKPDYARAFSERCRARAIIGQQLEVALADCTMALRLSPSDAVYLDGRGFTNLKLNRTGPAISDYTAALHIKSDRASSFFGRGIARLRNGDKVGGNADIAAAKKLQSTIADDFAKWGVAESLPSVEAHADNSGFFPIELVCPATESDGTLDLISQNSNGNKNRMRVIYSSYNPKSVEVAVAFPGEMLRNILTVVLEAHNNLIDQEYAHDLVVKANAIKTNVCEGPASNCQRYLAALAKNKSIFIDASRNR